MQDLPGINLDLIIAEIHYDINLLYVLPCTDSRYFILNHLRDRMFLLESIISSMKESQPILPPFPIEAEVAPIKELQSPSQSMVTDSLATFSLQELAEYDGKNGNLAYVAVNGTVYDVTNAASWAAASHFGLLAGKDLTDEFVSCHGGQPILSKLKVVGKLV